jgi:PRTRC genetic system protein B
MNVTVVLGADRIFELEQAVLLYRSGDRAFATVHEVLKAPEGHAPTLAPGRALGPEFLHDLVRTLQGATPPEIFPANVLHRTPDTVCWWTPAQRQRMFFRTDDAHLRRLNGQLFPHPALVFRATARDLYVRALAKSQRPQATTRLCVAPYWNTDPANGHVCLGSTPIPSTLTLHSSPRYESAFFASAFTHAAGAGRLTRHPKGVLACWTALVGKARFPAQRLVPGSESVLDFVS